MTNAPEHGARFEILRESTTEASATYAIAVHAHEGAHHASVTITASGVETRWTAEPPTWIAETTHGFVKMLQKNHAGDGSWPARLVRWRAESR